MTKQTIANDSIHNSEQGVQDGLTKREYFAAKAMQAYISNGDYGPIGCVSRAVEAADKLIKALNNNLTNGGTK